MWSSLRSVARRENTTISRYSKATAVLAPQPLCDDYMLPGDSAPDQLSVLFIGAPGVGKGTFGKLMAPYFNAQVLTSSYLLRSAAQQQMQNACSKAARRGEHIQHCIRTGSLVPDHVAVPIVCQFLRTVSGSFILDGFPRTLNQAQQMQQHCPLHLAIYFKLPRHVLVNKMLGRRVCSNQQCATVYNIFEVNEGPIRMPSMKPQIDGECDRCRHSLEIRSDDTLQVIEKRLQIFEEQNTPILDLYKSCGILLEHEVQRGVDDVPHILQKVNRHLYQRTQVKG